MEWNKTAATGRSLHIMPSMTLDPQPPKKSIESVPGFSVHKLGA
jgi:hypothetical protein